MFTVKKNILFYHFLSVGVIQGMIALIQLLVIPYTIRVIGIDGFGVVAVAQVVMLYLAGVTDFGFGQSGTRDIALRQSDNKTISTIFFRVLFTKLFLCLVAFLLLLVLVWTVPVFREHAILYLTAFVLVVGQSSLVTWFFQGIQKMQFIALLTLGGRLIFVILVFAFLKNDKQDFLFLLFFGTGMLVAGSISIFAACRLLKFEFVKPSRADIVSELKEGWHITLANLSGYTSQYANIFILRIFTNDLIAGYYGIAERIFFAMKQVLSVYSQVIYPRVCQVVQNSRSQLGLFFRQYYLPFLGMVLTGSGMVFIFSLQVVEFFIGHVNELSSFLLRGLCVATVVICLNIPACLGLLAANGKSSYFRIVTIGTLVNLGANIILVQVLDAKGTVISILLTELFITGGLYWQAYRLYLRNKSEGGRMLKTFFYESK